MGTKKSASLKTREPEEIKSPYFWILMAFVVLFLFISPYYKALFNDGQWLFEGPIYRAVLWSSISLLIVSLYLFNKWQVNDRRDVLSMVVWLIPLSFCISVFHAASFHSAVNSVYIHVMYAIFFVIGIQITRNQLGLAITTNTIVFSGYMIVLYGLMNWFGDADYHDAIFGGRLSNVFQYPNTYAALLIGLFFSGMLLTGLSKKWYIPLIHAFMYVPIVSSLLLTSSRGGFLVFAVILVIYLLFLPLTLQILNLVYLALSGLGSLLILNPITTVSVSYRTQDSTTSSFNGWVLIFAASLAVTLLVLVIQKYVAKWLDSKLHRIENVRFANIIIPLSLVLLSLIGIYALFTNSFLKNMLPVAIQDRLASITNKDSSLLSRSEFYSDSIQLIKDHPIIGAGGGAWSNMFQVYRSYAYISRQAHNFFLQYLSEVGFLGFAILIIFIAYILVQFIKHFVSQKNKPFQYERVVFVIIMSTILLHSIIDFDMSFVYLGALVFLCFGGMSSYAATNSTLKKTSAEKNKWNKLAPISLCVVSLIMLIVTYRAIQGNAAYNAAIKVSKVSGDYNQITEKLDKAIQYQPDHPGYVVTKVNLLNQAYQQTHNEKFFAEGIGRIQQLRKKEPFDLKVINEEYSLYVAKGELQQAFNLISSQQNRFRWDISVYEKLISLEFQLGSSANLKGLKKEANQYWDKALSIYNDVNKKLEYIKTLPESQQYDSYTFKVTPQIALSIGQVYYMKGEFDNASSTIAMAKVSNDFKVPLNKEIARWYLASLQKQNKSDNELFSLLTKEDPNEANHINSVLALIN